MAARHFAPCLLFLSVACHVVTPLEPLSPSKALKGYPKKIEVVRKNGRSLVLNSPAVIGDSLIGYQTSRRTEDSLRVAIPISDVASAGEREFSGTRTTVAVLGTTVAVGFVFLLIAAVSISNSMAGKT